MGAVRDAREKVTPPSHKFPPGYTLIICMIKPERLLWVDAPHFFAGAVWSRVGGDWVCVEAAPILRWMIGKRPAFVRAYLARKKWGHGWAI